MKRPISLLSETLINQMAAGEVIEHPASVVKELIENSLDAGSTDIRIDLISGGRTLIRISDNGDGIPEGEIPLAFLRHATSKVASIDDLFSINTLGFRGEALASIASIAKVQLITSTDGTKGGFYQIEGGVEILKNNSHREKGTTIEVKELFFNVPVRKKFLPAPDRLSHEALRTVRGLALAHPHVAFTLSLDHKVIFSLSAAQKAPFLDQLKERMGQLDPDKLKEEWMPLSVEEDGLSIKGWLLGPASHRPNRSEETLIINQRVVDPYLISFAVREGYGPALPDHRHPVFLLHLDLPHGIVDVNVHPQKKEVRLREKSRLHQFISKAIERALYPLPSIQQRERLPDIPLSIKWTPEQFTFSQEEREIEQQESFLPAIERPKILHCLKGIVIFDPLSIPSLLKEKTEGLAVLPTQQGYQKLLKEKEQVFGKQSLFIPLKIHLSPQEEEQLEIKKEKIPLFGFEIEYFGAKGYLIHTIPSGFEENEAVEFFRSLLAGSKQEETFSNRLLKHEEAEELLLSLSRLSDPSLDKQGKPLIKLLSREDLV